jgi:hypothetical protein
MSEARRELIYKNIYIYFFFRSVHQSMKLMSFSIQTSFQISCSSYNIWKGRSSSIKWLAEFMFVQCLLINNTGAHNLFSNPLKVLSKYFKGQASVKLSFRHIPQYPVRTLNAPATVNDFSIWIAQWYSAGLQAGRPGVRVPAEVGNFSLHHGFQTG